MRNDTDTARGIMVKYGISVSQGTFFVNRVTFAPSGSSTTERLATCATIGEARKELAKHEAGS